MPILEQLANRQETKNAKESRLMPRNILGGFEISLALFANLAVQKNNIQEGVYIPVKYLKIVTL